MANKATKAQVKRERSSIKMIKVLKKKGYKLGKLPKEKILHHVKPIIKKGKTTPKNTRVISIAKHIKIHKNRKKLGKI